MIETDTLSGIENVIGFYTNDTILGDAGNNSIDGQDGNDLLRGEDGEDTLSGGVGGHDTLIGGAGDDTFIAGLFNITEVMDFTHTVGEGGTIKDLLDISQFTDVTSVADLVTEIIGPDTHIDLGDGSTLILRNFTGELLDAYFRFFDLVSG